MEAFERNKHTHFFFFFFSVLNESDEGHGAISEQKKIYPLISESMTLFDFAKTFLFSALSKTLPSFWFTLSQFTNQMKYFYALLKVNS